MKVVKVLLIGVILALLVGCQHDVQISATTKVFQKQENGDKTYLSRGSGMAGGTTYAAGGGSATLTPASQGQISWGLAPVGGND